MASGGLWVYPEELVGGLATEPDALEACQMASFILWALSGRKYGKTRTITETYECACRRAPVRWAYGPGGAYPVLDAGEVVNLAYEDRWSDACGCGHHASGKARFRLRGTPIRAVHQAVLPDGSAVPSSAMRVSNSGWLEVDSASPGDVCGLRVSYTYGTGVPAAGRAAAKMLASEFLRSWSGDDECRLPDRTTNVSREGISFTIMDKQEFLDDLRTGVYEVDLFLRAVNPDRARKRARVFSPDLPKAWRTTAGSGMLSPAAYQLTTNYPLVIPQSAALNREFTRYVNGQAQHLTGWEWAAQIRESESVSAPLVLDLTPYLDVDAVDDTVLRLWVPGTVTSAVGELPSTASWDLFLWPAGDPDSAQLWLQGSVGRDAATSTVPAAP